MRCQGSFERSGKKTKIEIHKVGKKPTNYRHLQKRLLRKIIAFKINHITIKILLRKFMIETHWLIKVTANLKLGQKNSE